MKKTIVLLVSLMSVSALAETKILCQDSVYRDAAGNYKGMGAYDQTVKNINEEAAKFGATTASAPSISLRDNNSAVICVTVSK
jgi:hypothetical protein